ncbi:hypothetical protein [Archangium sp.]|uniref:hypothetical protein n=1 Tax=Archangium sp. TaxID=1872627 RepID=UPI002D6EE7DB|nr:hypothetical protein [Archangium sp.]HYO58959.1 hypothetical protein [Archangium sp.]
MTAVGPDSAQRAARQSALAAQLAFHSAVLDVSGSTRRISGELSRRKASGRGIGGGNGVFVRYVDYGAQQLRWIDAQLAAATRLANAASQVEDPDMQLALLRLAGPRLEAAMMGSLLLAVWLDFLHLADAVLTQHLYSVERMFADMWRWQEMLEPAMTALSSLEHEQVEAAAQDVPALVGHLTGELAATLETVRKGAGNVAKVLVLKGCPRGAHPALGVEVLAALGASARSRPARHWTLGGRQRRDDGHADCRVRRVGGDDAPIGAGGRPLPARRQCRSPDSGRPGDAGAGAQRAAQGRARDTG